MAENRRWSVRMTSKDPLQAETIKKFDKLMESGKYPTDVELFREGVRVLYDKEHSAGKQAATRRLVEKAADKAANEALIKMVDVNRLAVELAFTDVSERMTESIANMVMACVQKATSQSSMIASAPFTENTERTQGKEPEDDLPEGKGYITDEVGDIMDMF